LTFSGTIGGVSISTLDALESVGGVGSTISAVYVSGVTVQTLSLGEEESVVNWTNSEVVNVVTETVIGTLGTERSSKSIGEGLIEGSGSSSKSFIVGQIPSGFA